MSTVGKTLIVFQVAFSILLMAFAAGVSSVQTNWKKKATEATAKLEKANSALQTAQQSMAKLQNEKTASEKSLKDAADKARGEADAARDKIKQQDLQLAQVRTELENKQAEAKIAGEEARARRDEAVSLRGLNERLHTTRDELITQNRQLSDKITNLEQDARSMVAKHNRLLNDYATLQKAMRAKGFDADPKEYAALIEPPPVVQGVVLEVKKGGRNGSELIEISEGSDVGLAKGHELYVYRPGSRGKYLGKIRLDYVDYRTAVGVLIPSSKNGDIQRGDNVTTKL